MNTKNDIVIFNKEKGMAHFIKVPNKIRTRKGRDMTTKKEIYAVLICGLLLSGCASTGSDSNVKSQTNAGTANTDCAASGQKSYEMADGSIVCY